MTQRTINQLVKDAERFVALQGCSVIEAFKIVQAIGLGHAVFRTDDFCPICSTEHLKTNRLNVKDRCQACGAEQAIGELWMAHGKTLPKQEERTDEERIQRLIAVLTREGCPALAGAYSIEELDAILFPEDLDDITQ